MDAVDKVDIVEGEVVCALTISAVIGCYEAMSGQGQGAGNC